MAAQYCRERAAAGAKLQYKSIQYVWCIWDLWDVVVVAFCSKDHSSFNLRCLSVTAHNHNY